MNVYIFRHGMTHFSKNDIPYGDKVETAEILEEGIPAIKSLAKYLKDIPTEANFTSPFIRCVATSQIVSKISGKEFEVDRNLRDWDPRNESVQEMIVRILKFTSQLQTTNYSSISVCTHGYPINALIAYFTKSKIEETDLPNFPKTGVLTLIENKKVSYKDFNSIGGEKK